MAKAYWVATYRSIPTRPLGRLREACRTGHPAGGGRFLARGTAKTYEAGLAQRTVLIEFDSVAPATATND